MYAWQKGRKCGKTILKSIVFKTIAYIPKQYWACVMSESSHFEAFFSNIYKCQSINFHMLCLDLMYLHYFKNYSGLVCVKRKQSYCRRCIWQSLDKWPYLETSPTVHPHQPRQNCSKLCQEPVSHSQSQKRILVKD